jgi:dCMP deaminase
MPAKQQRTVLAAYVPVLHAGYLAFFKKYAALTSTFYVFDSDVLKIEDSLRKDLRALAPKQAVEVIRALNIFSSVELANLATVKKLLDKPERLVLADDEISHVLVDKYAGENSAQVSYYPVFLRWDRQALKGINVSSEDDITTTDSVHTKLIHRSLQEAYKSSDIWRRIGAILITSDHHLALTHNSSKPTEYTAWIDGDARNLYSKGEDVEKSLFFHAEASLIADAAKQGISLQGAVMYTTTYPCPACAMLIAHSGIAELYYKDGYASLNGRENLINAGVKITRVIADFKEERPEELVKYR